MSKFIVDESFWKLFPQAKIGVILLKDFQSQEQSPDSIIELLKESQKTAKTYLIEDKFSDNAEIQVYRQAYQKFKTKKGARSSIEALLKRVSKDKPIGSINPLVDIYNAASLRYALPVGAEDRDTFEGDLRLELTEGGDAFYLIGDSENTPTLAGELCYRDDKGAVCRCLNWRDGERTMITSDTKNAFIVIELLDSDRMEDLQAALDFIEKNAQKYLKGKSSQKILDITHQSMTI
ncbi:B3/B4 domain-containing protein [Streptococcus ratti]|uniref:B3/4 domain-containing protein n=1 Tax=Streptococcus ratti TaxID=1341 RepID=A0A7X9LD06_STRRT|nr:B3/4 domain-containing protein [Streptococcus ratti]NMD48487.1 B3/4 domain-containing protein [Streptococcus ratti]